MSWGVDDLVVHHGGTAALDGVSVTVEPGAIGAVVGGDGAGKTTLLRTLVGRLSPSAGTVRRPPRHRIGAMVAPSGVWDDLTVTEHVEFVAAAHGLAGAGLADRVDELLGRAGLERARARTAAALSGGMRRKLAVVLALLHEPDLVVLDEPTTGVDPVSRAELWRLIGHAAASGAAVLLATSYLDEAERAGTVLVLHDGASLLAGPPERLVGGRSLEAAVLAALAARREDGA